MLSPYGHYAFWVKLKLNFWALSFFEHCQISLPFVIGKDELFLLFLNYAGFSSKHRRVSVLWGFIKKIILTYFKIICIYKLNFRFFNKSRYRKIYSFATLSHLHLTYSMVQSPSWEANWFAASQEIPCISRNPKVHHRTHKGLPPVSIWANPIQSIYPHPTSWRSILLLSTHLRLGLLSGPLTSML